MVTKVVTRGQHNTHTTRLSTGNKFWVHANYVCTGTIVSLMELTKCSQEEQTQSTSVSNDTVYGCGVCLCIIMNLVEVKIVS